MADTRGAIMMTFDSRSSIRSSRKRAEPDQMMMLLKSDRSTPTMSGAERNFPLRALDL